MNKPDSRWSSMFLLPEHMLMVGKQDQENKKKKRPVLDEQELENFAYLIQESLQYQKEIKISIYREYNDKEVTGVVTGFNQFEKKIKLQDQNDYTWIKFNDITNVVSL